MNRKRDIKRERELKKNSELENGGETGQKIKINIKRDERQKRKIENERHIG